jgi:hypothetical protein
MGKNSQLKPRRLFPMPVRTPASAGSRCRAARWQDLERDTPLVALAAAREVVAEASRWLGVALSDALAVWLAGRARECYAHSASFRATLVRHGWDASRETLDAFLRHWLAARFYETEPALFARLPADYAWGGAELPDGRCAEAAREPLSVEARSLLGV